MPEETILTNTEVSDDAGLFDDVDTQETAEPEQEQTSTETVTPSEAEKKFTVKYNGQEMSLTEAEIITHAQKGLNYDHVKGELDTLRGQKESFEKVSQYAKIVEQLAKDNNMTVDEWTKAVEESRREGKIQKLMSESPGADEKIVRRLFELEEKERQREAEAAQKAEELKSIQEKERIQQRWTKFFEAYPDLRGKEPAELPQEFMSMVQEGEDPITAYRAYENKELKTKLKMLEQNEANKSKAPGGIKNEGGGGTDDPFLQGFFSE